MPATPLPDLAVALVGLAVIFGALPVFVGSTVRSIFKQENHDHE